MTKMKVQFSDFDEYELPPELRKLRKAYAAYRKACDQMHDACGAINPGNHPDGQTLALVGRIAADRVAVQNLVEEVARPKIVKWYAA